MKRIKSAEEYHDQYNVVCEELKVELKLTDHTVVTIGKVRQKEESGKGGSYTWPIWMVQLILVQLVNGMPPESVAPDILSQDSLAMPGAKVIVQDLPSINFIRSCRSILRIIGENLAAYDIRKVGQWYQLLSDGTGRHQNYLKNLVISIIDDKRLRPLIPSTSIILKGDTYEQQVDAVLPTITSCWKICSSGRRYWSIHTLHTSMISHTRAL